MKKTIAALVFAFTLTGCATDPAQFSQSVNNAVENIQTASVASVSIGTNIVKAVLALVPAVLDVLSLWHN